MKIDGKSWSAAAGVFLVLCLCICWADFSTKGEPREALVACDMLRTGNWILPIDNAGDMAYKPPLFHWMIALFSLPVGHVTEFTARLPSALALTGLLCMTAWWIGVRRREAFAMATCGVLLTCFEVFRAGAVCRVDMLLTFFICAAMMLLMRWSEQRRRWWLLVWAALCMSGAALTKGPVGVLLPAAVYWIYALATRRNILLATAVCAAVMAAACVLPLAWYYAAWVQGGERFYTLAYEENIGRMLGHMSYESHVKPFWYNFLVLASGTLPWCAIALYGWICCKIKRWKLPRLTWDDTAKFALTAIIVIFIFYSIPKSKRSVYLLPMYPFIAYFVTVYARRFIRAGKLTARGFMQLTVGLFALLVIGIGMVFPVMANGKSDRPKAEKIAAVVGPNGKIYTYIPDRFMRFYNTDFYIGQRLYPLLPSGQTAGRDIPMDARSVRLPADSSFYLLTSDKEMAQTGDTCLPAYLRRQGLRADTLYLSEGKMCDATGRALLMRIHK